MVGCYCTTDGGENWISNVGGIGISFVFFINQDIGWVTFFSNYVEWTLNQQMVV